MADRDDVAVETARLRNELEDLRDALVAARERHERDFGDMARQRDEASERADDRSVQLETAERTIDDQRNQIDRLVVDAELLAAQRDEAAAEAREFEAILEEDHLRTIAKLVEDHQRELLAFASQRDGAMIDAERAAIEVQAAWERADQATRELQDTRRKLDDLISASTSEVDRLAGELDAARGQVNDLAEMRKSAEAEILRVGEQFMAVEEEKSKQLARVTDNQDRFIVELVEGHEKALAALAQQRDEALSQRDVVAEKVAKARGDAELAAGVLEAERRRVASLATEREEAALQLDKLAAEAESAMRREALLRAEQDALVAKILEGHRRELASALRQRDFASQTAKAASKDIADLKATIVRLLADRDDDALANAHGERDFALQRAKSAERDIAELKATIARLLVRD